MQKLHFSTVINAPKEKVWNTMLNQDSFRKWSEPFGTGTHYVGDLKKGGKILFFADSAGENGMVSRVEESRPFEYVSIEHLGYINGGKEDTTSEEAKKWAGAHEKYSLKQSNGKTKVSVDTDIIDENKDMFQDIWPKALQKLKELAEK